MYLYTISDYIPYEGTMSTFHLLHEHKFSQEEFETQLKLCLQELDGFNAELVEKYYQELEESKQRFAEHYTNRKLPGIDKKILKSLIDDQKKHTDKLQKTLSPNIFMWNDDIMEKLCEKMVDNFGYIKININVAFELESGSKINKDFELIR